MAIEKINVTEKLKAAKISAIKDPAKIQVKPKVYNMADDDSARPKVMIYGHTGTGKTFLIVGMLECGETVLVISTDFGANGLATVKNELKKRAGNFDHAAKVWTPKGKEMLSRLRGMDLSTYDQISGFFADPTDIMPDIAEYAPTVMDWEGFSSFNVDILDEHILSMAPGADNAGEMRHEGWTHTKQDWQGMKRGTTRMIRKFLALALPDGTVPAKVLTCLEAQADVNAITGVAEKSVLVHGSGKALMGPAFDVILQAFKETNKETGQVTFNYRCDGDSGKFLVKSRGYDLKPIEPADPTRIWRIICGGPVVPGDLPVAA